MKLHGWVAALLLGVLGAASARAQGGPGWEDLSGPAPTRAEYTLWTDLRVAPDLVHVLYVGTVAGGSPAGHVDKVTYTLLQEPLDPAVARLWLAGGGDAGGGNVQYGGHVPRPGPHEDPDRETVVVTTPGPGGDQPGFVLSSRLSWVPRQLLAVVKKKVSAGGGEVRLVADGPRLLDPSLSILMKPVYQDQPTAVPGGARRPQPQLMAVELTIRRDPARPGAADRIREVAFGIGIPDRTMQSLPDFERVTMAQLRKQGGKLTVADIDVRRGHPLWGLGTPRDYIWVLAIDDRGQVEDYAAWRPSILRDEMPGQARDLAKATTPLEPRARALPPRAP